MNVIFFVVVSFHFVCFLLSINVDAGIDIVSNSMLKTRSNIHRTINILAD